MESESNNFSELPANLAYFCKAHQKTNISKTSFDAHLTANIAIVAGLLGNMVKVELDSGFSVYPNLYSYIIGNSGQGKSGYLSHGYALISDIQMQKDKLYKEARKAKFLADKAFKQENKERQSRGELPLIPDKNQNYPEGVFNCDYPLCTMDFTIEGIQQDMAILTGGNSFVIRDELIGTFKMFKKQGRQGDIPFLNDAYEAIGKTYKVTRKMDAAKIPTIYNMCANILGTIQTRGIRSLLKDYLKEDMGDGFFARFQNISILPEDSQHQEPEPLDKGAVESFKLALEEIVEARIRYSKIDPCDQVPSIIKLTKEAENAYYDYSLHLKQIGKETKNVLFEEHIHKTATEALKIALNFHMLERPSNVFFESYKEPISLKTMKDAIKYTNHKIKIAKILYGVDEEVSFELKEEAKRLHDYIIDVKSKFYKANIATGWSSYLLSRTQSKALPKKFNKCVDTDRLEDLLSYLEDEKCIFSFCHVNTTNNKQLTWYSIMPEYAAEQDKKAVEQLLAKTMPIIETDNKNIIQFSKERPQIEIIKYPTKEENKEHIEKLKASIDARIFIGNYIKLKNCLGLCPFHDDKNPSFSVTKDFFNCFACHAKGSVIDFIMKYKGLDLSSSIKAIEDYAGIKLVPKKIRLIDQIWEDAILNPVQSEYLKNRLNGYEFKINDSITYSNSLSYSHNGHDANYPAMIAKITNSNNEFIGIQRTYLSDDLSKKRNIGNNPSKKILGKSAGGYVNLIDQESNTTLIIGEGIETVLSLYVFKKDEIPNCSVYANLGATNIPHLPARFNRIIVAQDNDDAGMSYAEAMIKKYGDIVEVEMPNEEFKDFNDVLAK